MEVEVELGWGVCLTGRMKAWALGSEAAAAASVKREEDTTTCCPMRPLDE